jgi:hypothetical protein
LKIHFNIILPSASGSPKWSPSLRYSQHSGHQKAQYCSLDISYYSVPLNITTCFDLQGIIIRESNERDATQNQTSNLCNHKNLRCCSGGSNRMLQNTASWFVLLAKYQSDDLTQGYKEGRSMWASMGKSRGAYRFWWGNSKGRDHLEDLGVDG